MRVVELKVLKDEQGRVRVRIHFFVRDDKGPVNLGRAIVRTLPAGAGTLQLGGGVGYIACQPKCANIFPQHIGGAIVPVVHSDDVRAVTCPECIATEQYKGASAELAEVLAAKG